MDRNAVIIVTGAAGFIGSCLTGYLNRKGYFNIIIVDDFNDETKKHNYDEKKICARVDKEELFDWLNRYKIRIDFIFHLGAYTQSSKQPYSALREINTSYSKKIWDYCTVKKIPLVYTSFDGLQQRNNENEMQSGFDSWVIKQYNEEKLSPPFWAALNLSRVYGPNEYHKGSGASLVLQYFEQVSRKGKITLQKLPGNPSTANERDYDFVYVKDVVDVCYWMMQKSAEDDGCPASGFYDVGSGFTHSYAEIADEIFKSAGREAAIEYVDTNEDYPVDFVKVADISKLRNAGYKKEFYSLADGVRTYVMHFLSENKYY